MIALCHVFTFVADEAAAVAAVRRLGLRESFRRTHPGQGTANLCACFENAYLELLWPTNWVELRGDAVAPTGLADRADWQRTGASPIGIGVRTTESLPFPVWGYRQDFWPPGFVLEVAEDSRDPRLPFVFRSPGTLRPDAWTDGRAETRQDGSEIAAVSLGGDGGTMALAALVAAGVIDPAGPDGNRMELTLTGRGRLLLPDLVWREV